MRHKQKTFLHSKRGYLLENHLFNNRPLFKTPHFYFIILIPLFVTVIFIPVLSSRAIYIDDNQYMTENHLVRNPSVRSGLRFFREVLNPSTVEGYYQPLSMLSLMMDNGLGGRPDNLAPFHRTGLLLHIFNTLLIVIILYKLFKNLWLAGCMGLLFGLHPITVESVAWISDRKTLLSSFFCLLSLLIYIRYVNLGKRHWLTTALLFYVLALLSKPTSLLVPFLFLILDYGFFNRLNWDSVKEKSVFYVMAVIAAVITFLSQRNTASLSSDSEFVLFHASGLIGYNFLFYLRRFFWSFDIPRYFPYPQKLLSSLLFHFLMIALLIVLIALCIFLLRRSKKIVCGILIYMLALLPVIQFLRFTGMGAADKYLYFPALGILLALAAIVEKVSEKTGTFRKYATGLLCLCFFVVIIFHSLVIRKGLSCWKDTVSLYNCLLQKSPHEALLHNNLGIEYRRIGKINKAIYHFTEAIAYDPKSIKAYNSLGLALNSLHKYQEAMEYLMKAAEINPKDAETYCNIGIICESQDNTKEARNYYQKAIALKPSFIEAHMNYANLLLAENRYNEARLIYDSLMDSGHYAEANLGIGMIYYHTGQYQNAIIKLQYALQYKKELSRANYYLGMIYLKQQKYDLAIQHYLYVVQMEPLNIEVQILLADTYLSVGDREKAISCYEKALKMAPNHIGLLSRLTILYSQSNVFFNDSQNKAVEYGLRACELTDYKNPGVLDVLSVAYASSGQYEKAIELSEKALYIAIEGKRTDLQEKIKSRLVQYRQKVKHSQ